MKHKIEAIIFDLDGTLIDTIHDISAAANRMLKNHGYPVHSVGKYLEWIGNGAARLIAEALPDGLEQENLESLVKEFKSTYSENLHNESRLYDGTADLLDYLKQNEMPISILSNKPHLLTIDVVAYYLSGWTFRHIFGQRDHIPRKPSPAAALEIAQDLGIDARNILIVGDSKNDIVTASVGGFISVGVAWGYGNEKDLVDSGADYIIHKPKELIELLSK